MLEKSFIEEDLRVDWEDLRIYPEDNW